MLDSLFRNNRVQETDIHVYIDGNGNGCDKVCEDYGIGYTVHGKLLGNLRNIVSALRDSFEYNDKVILLEDDHILRPDTIEFCLHCNLNNNFVSLCGDYGVVGNGYRPIGNIISKELWGDLNYWLLNGEYIGKQKPLYNGVLMFEQDCYDSLFYTYAIYKNVKTFYAGWYVAHFGLEGLNQGKLDTEGIAITESMFCGKPTQWLDNVLKVFSNRDNMSDRYKKVFIPKEFNYNATIR